MNSAVSLAAGLPVGRLSARCLVVGAYVVPGVVAWAAAGALLSVLRLGAAGLVLAAAYGLYYGIS
ncbi:MAG TPA: hypothetical protein VMA95_13700, partial [Streptosporangiaceae bacterium]|nr:hypothetical protein [Streptosporangiaceae bacterium]